MNAFVSFYNSSIGKKLVVGLTGLCLCMYLVVHLGGNLLLFKNDGGAAFDRYAETLPNLLVIRVIEIFLFAIFLIHIVTATVLWILNKQARRIDYQLNRPGENSTLFSRTMQMTGSIVYIFLAFHLRSFWYPARFQHDQFPSMYGLVTEAFSHPLYCGFYVMAMAMLAFHLKHGFQSAFQTFGIKHQRYAFLIEAIGAIFWLVIPAAFASMPVYFLMHS